MDRRARLVPGASSTGIDGVTVDRDEAGNVWATLPGDSDRFIIIGGHIDSVPDGGWLDGALNVVGGLEVLRALRRRAAPVHDQARRLGRRGGRALRSQPARLERLRRHARPRLGARPDRPRRHRAPRRARRPGRRPRPHGRVGLAARRRARLPGAAHRAGPGARAARPAARRGARHVRRPAPPRDVHRARTRTRARARCTCAATRSSPPRAARSRGATTRRPATTCARRPAS